MEQMHQVSSDGTISGTQVGAYMSMSANEIGTASAAYQAQMDHMKKMMDVNLAGGKVGQLAAYKRQKDMLSKHRDEVDAKLTELRVLTGSIASPFLVVLISIPRVLLPSSLLFVSGLFINRLSIRSTGSRRRRTDKYRKLQYSIEATNRQTT